MGTSANCSFRVPFLSLLVAVYITDNMIVQSLQLHEVGLGPCQVKVKDFQERLSRLESTRERLQELCQAFRQVEPHRGTAQAQR